MKNSPFPQLLLFVAVAAFFFLVPLKIHGQSQITLETRYPIFLDAFSDIYHPSLGYSLEYTYFGSVREHRNGMGVGLGYYSFNPMQDGFRYPLEGRLDYATVYWSSFTTIMFTINTARYWTLHHNLDFNAGLDLGLYYTAFDVIVEHPVDGDGAFFVQAFGGIIPKAGFLIRLSNKLSISLQSRLEWIIRPLDIDTDFDFTGTYGYTTPILSNAVGICFKFY